MQVDVILYGALRVIAGKQIVHLSFDVATITMIQLLETLVTIYPRIKPYLLNTSTDISMNPATRVLLNGVRPEYSTLLATALHNNDRITFLVPGG